MPGKTALPMLDWSFQADTQVWLSFPPAFWIQERDGRYLLFQRDPQAPVTTKRTLADCMARARILAYQEELTATE